MKYLILITCSKKCVVSLVSLVSNNDPASIPDADGGGAGTEGGLSGNAKAIGKHGHVRLRGGKDVRVAREGGLK